MFPSKVMAMVTIETISESSPDLGADARLKSTRDSHLVKLARAVGLWWRRRSTRVHLAQLTEDQLRDVGLSPEMAEREIRKSRLLLVERAYQPPF